MYLTYSLVTLVDFWVVLLGLHVVPTWQHFNKSTQPGVQGVDGSRKSEIRKKGSRSDSAEEEKIGGCWHICIWNCAIQTESAGSRATVAIDYIFEESWCSYRSHSHCFGANSAGATGSPGPQHVGSSAQGWSVRFETSAEPEMNPPKRPKQRSPDGQSR